MSNTLLFDYNKSSKFKTHLESVEQGQKTFSQWRRLQDIHLLLGFDTAMLRLEAWVNEFYTRYDGKRPDFALLSTSSRDWPYIQVDFIRNYKIDLSLDRYNIAFVNEQISAIKIGARVALRSGRIERQNQLLIEAITSLDSYQLNKGLLDQN